MPNWCECDLEIRGNAKRLKEFIKFAKTRGSVLNTNKFIPYPKKFADLDRKAQKLGKKGKYIKDGFNSGGYEWCIQNWGTKWGICHAELREASVDACAFSGAVHEKLQKGNTSRLEYGFDCAWSPPIPVILKMSEMFPELDFELRYFECGAAFQGLYRCRAGKVSDDREWKYFGDRGG